MNKTVVQLATEVLLSTRFVGPLLGLLVSRRAFALNAAKFSGCHREISVTRKP